MGGPKLHPIRWHPPKAPARTRAANSAPPAPEPRVIATPGYGAEDVCFDQQGRILTGLADGRIMRIDGDSVEEVANTHGRPLGIEALPDGRFIACDARRGLLRIDVDAHTVESLAEQVHGTPMKFCNNAAVAKDGTIFFSDSTTRFGIDHWRAELFEHSGTGRLLRRDPNGDVDVVATGLQFANGVALSPDESFVAVAETSLYRVTKVALVGPEAGQATALIENLPGFPDNMSTGSDGRFWIALASPRNAMLDLLSPRTPILRRVGYTLPQRLQPQAKPTMWVIAVDADGRVAHDLQRPGDRYGFVTGVRERNGTVALGSLHQSAVAILTLPNA